MSCEISSVEIFDANLALNHNLRALSLDMLKQLGPGHVLEILVIANVASKFRTFVHSVLLKFTHRLPNDWAISFLVALVRKLTKVNTVLQHFVNVGKEVSSGLTIWATNIVPCRVSLYSACSPLL